MRTTLLVLVAAFGVIATLSVFAESIFYRLVAAGNPEIVIFINGPEQIFQINGRIEGDKKTIQKELQRLTDAFGPDLPLALVVTPDTTVCQLQEWIVICQQSGVDAIRAYVSSEINWKGNQEFDKSKWFDVQ